MAALSAAAFAVVTMIPGTPALASRATGGPAGAGRALEPAASSQRVMLITGDIVTVSARPGGPRAASVVRAHPGGPGGVFQTFTEGRDLYVVPQSAVPYLGKALSLGLFDVTRLASQEHGAMSLTVALRLRRAAGPAAVPGVTVVHRSGLAATGRLTEASARAFGAVLARTAGRGRGRAAPDPFAGVSSIAPVPPARPAASLRSAAAKGRPTAAEARPAAPRITSPRATPAYTLKLKGVSVAGQRASGDLVLIYDVDNLNRFDGTAVFENGSAKVQVPAGHYAALCFFVTHSLAAEVMDPQFTVSRNRSITLDARRATARVSIDTPKPARDTVMEVGFGRRDALGQVAPYGLIGGRPMSFKVQPIAARAVTIGKLYYYVYTRRFSPAAARSAYTYDLEFPTTGRVPADQHHIVKASGLASVASAYPAGRTDQRALDARSGALAWESAVLSVDLALTTPLRRTEYYTASPAVTWSGLYDEVWIATSRTGLGEIDSSWVHYTPGERLSATWGSQPQHPRLLERDLFINRTYCPACISGDTLDLLVFPYGDNAASHRSYPDAAGAGPHLSESQAYAVYANGTQVNKGTGFLDESVTLPGGTRKLRIGYDTVRSAPYFPLSTRADTYWTVETRATRALPHGWYCTEANQINCAVLPLMVADYGLPVNLLGQLRRGRVVASVAISHLAAAPIAVKSVRLSVSFDGGTSWKRATVTALRHGNYAVSFAVPARSRTDGFGALRLKATDADGGVVRQTIQRAFAVGA